MVIDAYLHAAERAEMVVNLPEIADQWLEPSVLDGHTVGSLAAHCRRVTSHSRSLFSTGSSSRSRSTSAVASSSS